jgi:uncharacterized RDD family membrane protein YckC
VARGAGFNFKMQWYYAIDGERFGPVPHSELERLVQVGTVLSDSLIWRQGMNEWQTLAAVRAANPAWIAERRQATPSIEEPSAAAPTALTPPLGFEAPAAELEAVLVYAGFWPRCGAYLVDLFLWWMVWQIFVGIVGTAYFPEAMAIAAHGAGYQPKPEELLVLVRFLGAACVIGLVWSIAYDAVFLLRFGATPGKLLFGLRVVQADGSPLGFTRIVLRSLSKALVCLTLGIGYLIVAFDEHKRGLHDFICNTRVIKKR